MSESRRSNDLYELELQRLRSEVALNEARTKKLGSSGALKTLAILLGVAASVWAFAATFTGFLADLSQISSQELPKARERVDSLLVANAALVEKNEALLREKERADSLQVGLEAALATLLGLEVPMNDETDGASPPWLGAVFFVEVEEWDGPLVVALQDEGHGSGNSMVSGFRFNPVAVRGEAVWGNWSSTSVGIRIEENVGGLLHGHHSIVDVDFTRPLPKGGYAAEWRSHAGEGSGTARRVYRLADY